MITADHGAAGRASTSSNGVAVPVKSPLMGQVRIGGGAKVILATVTNGEAMSAASGGLAANGTLMVIGAAGSLRVARNAGHPAAQFPYRCSYLFLEFDQEDLQRVMHRIFPTPIPEVRQVTKSDIQSHNLGRSTTHLNKGRSYVTKHQAALRREAPCIRRRNRP